ncbi:hypothetical protein [Candidatus Allofournierella merdipullorum]|uniref:hypothetical protein n=1 Tax=Candidatus Allofournierella merdipullorum TaxID=2838595 RepID=UPI00374F2DC2
MSRNTGSARYARHFLRCVYTGLTFIVLVLIARALVSSVEKCSQWVIWCIQHMPAIGYRYVDVLATIVPAAFVLYAMLRVGIPLYIIVKNYHKATTLKTTRNFFWLRVWQVVPMWAKPIAKPLIARMRNQYEKRIEQKIRDAGVAVYPYVCAMRRRCLKRKSR